MNMTILILACEACEMNRRTINAIIVELARKTNCRGQFAGVLPAILAQFGLIAGTSSAVIVRRYQHEVSNDNIYRWHFADAIRSMAFDPWHLVNGVGPMTFCRWHLIDGI